MPQYKYPVKGGAKWMTKFNYTDPKSGIVKTAYKRGFDSKREAKKYEDDFIDSLIAPEEDEVEVIRTYGDVFQEYLMSHKRADIKESSLETKFNIFNKHIFPTFEEVPIDSITDDDIANWQKKMKLCIQPNGKHFSEAYLRTIQSQFNSIINYAFSKGYLKSNPLADIKNMGIKDKRVEFWTPEEYERFVLNDEEAFAKELQALWNEKQTEKPKQNKSELLRFQKRYDELSKLIRGLYENLVSGLLPERQYKQLLKDYGIHYKASRTHNGRKLSLMK